MQQAAGPPYARSRCTYNLILNMRLRPWLNILFNGTMHLISAEGRITKLIIQWIAQGDSVCQGTASLSRNDNDILLSHLNPISHMDIPHTNNSSLHSLSLLVTSFIFLISTSLKLKAENVFYFFYYYSLTDFIIF